MVGLTELSCAARDAVVAVDDLDDLIADKESLGVELGESAVAVTQALGQLREVMNKVFTMRFEKEEALNGPGAMVATTPLQPDAGDKGLHRMPGGHADQAELRRLQALEAQWQQDAANNPPANGSFKKRQLQELQLQQSHAVTERPDDVNSSPLKRLPKQNRKGLFFFNHHFSLAMLYLGG